MSLPFKKNFNVKKSLYVEHAISNNIFYSENTESEDVKDWINTFNEKLYRSQKFFVGNLEQLNLNNRPSFFKFPYDDCYFEFKQNFDDDPVGILYTKIDKEHRLDGTNLHLLFLVFSTTGKRNDYSLFPIPYEIKEEDLNREVNDDDVLMDSFCPEEIGRNLSKTTLEIAQNTEFTLFFSQVLRLVYSTLALLECNNIETVTIKKKRTKREKKSFDFPEIDYKVLALRADEKKYTSENNTGVTGTKKRQHLRRGHIRRLSSGKTTWVNSCIVGKDNESVLYKDYNILL